MQTLTHYEAQTQAGWAENGIDFWGQFKPEEYALPVLGEKDRFIVGTLAETCAVLNIVMNNNLCQHADAEVVKTVRYELPKGEKRNGRTVQTIDTLRCPHCFSEKEQER